MGRTAYDESTAGLTGSRPGALSGATRPAISLPALTILFHPDLSRVGERCLLSELAGQGQAELGRLAPEFSPPSREHWGSPLGDRFLSRKPIWLRNLNGGEIELDRGECRSQVRVDGESLTGPRRLSAEARQRGVVLELADRLVLLLHDYAPPPVRESQSFGLVGASPGIERLRVDIRRVADLDLPILLRGETGTGKELVARAIHDAGPRRDRPFLAVNLGSVSPSLAASELFGAAKGAFTGSVRERPGHFRQAQRGTLFLDEVGEAPPEVQVSLLRTLETGEVLPVGSEQARRVDTRVLAATDANLEEKVDAGEMRAPLLHRLASYEVWLPPLRHRLDDLGRLLVYFLQLELLEVGEGDRMEAPDATAWLDPRIVAKLAQWNWPGNVRQLRNFVRQMVIGSRSLPQLELSQRQETLLAAGPASSADFQDEALGSETTTAPPVVPRRKPSEVSDEELVETLRSCHFDLAATATRLGVSRASLYGLIEAAPGVRLAKDLAVEEILACHRRHGGDLPAMALELEVSRHALRRRVRELGLE